MTNATQLNGQFKMTAEYKVTKFEDGYFEYRGVGFRRVDSLRGYSGHYQTYGRKGIAANGETRKKLLENIDYALANNLTENSK
mgnify:CR=1 FL=1